MKKIVAFTLLIMMLTLAVCPGQIAAATSDVWDDGVAVSDISSGDRHSLFLKKDGSLWGVGSNKFGCLGLGGSMQNEEWEGVAQTNTPVKIADDVIYAHAAENYSTLYITKDGVVWGLGNNDSGQFADGKKGGLVGYYGIDSDFGSVTSQSITRQEYSYYTSPVKVCDDAKQVCSDGGKSIILKNDGSAWSVYTVRNETTQKNEAKWEKLADDVHLISPGNNFHFLIKNDESLWTQDFGYMREELLTLYEISLLDNSDKKFMEDVISAKGSEEYSMFLKKDGSLWANGIHIPDSFSGDGSSRLGRNPGTDPEKMQLFKIADHIIDMGITASASYYVTADNQLFACGSNIPATGQNTGNKYIKLMDGVSSISSKTSYMKPQDVFIQKTDGSIWSWGGYVRNRPDYDELSLPPGSNPVVNFSDIYCIKSPVSSVTDTPEPVITSQIQTPPQPQPANPELTAIPIASKVLVNGENVSFDAYTISDSNYLKLRDVAYVLNGTEKQFDVSWDDANNAIILVGGEIYTIVGGEMAGKGSGMKTPIPTSSKLFFNGKEVVFTAYNIENNNYFKLRDLGAMLDFGVDWDGVNNTIMIDTNKGYTPNT